MGNETIRIGFVGAGENTTLRHIPGFKALDGVELISVANRSRASGERISGEYKIPKVYDTWGDLISASDTDAICIGTWPNMHYSTVLAALDNNKHVLTEARMSLNATDAHKMLEASQGNPSLITQIVPSPMTLKLDTTIKQLIEDDYLGNIMSLNLAVHVGDFVNLDTPFHWRLNRDLSGYNVMSMGIWYEAIMRWIGPAISVSAVTKVNVRNRKDANGARAFISIPDQVEVLCEMASGPIAHLSISTVFGLAPSPQVWIFGTEGTLNIDASNMTIFGGRRGDKTLSEIPVPNQNIGGWRVEEEFINAIRGKESITHTTFEDGVKYMEFTEAVTRSSQTGKTIYLPL